MNKWITLLSIIFSFHFHGNVQANAHGSIQGKTQAYAQLKQENELQMMEFNKPINYKDWTQKIKMSFEDLIKSLSPNIDLYRFPQMNGDLIKSAAYFLKISKIPEQLYKVFYKDIALSRAQAIYLSEDEIEGYVNRPTILMRNDSDHWTLIHEYTHHLFHEARKQTNTTLPKNFRILFSDSAETMDEYFTKFKNNNFQFTNADHKNELIKAFLTATDLMIQMNLSFSLEEVTIENMIRSYYATNRNNRQTMNQDGFESSLEYINSSFERTNMNIAQYQQIGHALISKVQKDSPEWLELNKRQMNLAKLKQQIKNFKISN